MFAMAILWCATFCFLSLFQVLEAAQCKEISFTSDKCRSASVITIASQKVYKGSEDVRIALTGSHTEATWFCGSSKERLAWGDNANQIRVNFHTDGNIQWTVYNCDDLSGPVRAGIKCSDEAFSTACPGGVNGTCVFEVSTSTSFIDKTTTTVEVGAEVAHEITESTTATISGSITQARTTATKIEYNHKSYLIIPAGFKFCSYSDAESVKDVLAPTGYKWQCSLTKFVQAKLSYNGPCSDLPKCTKRVCIAGGNGESSAAKPALAFLFIMFTQTITTMFIF